MESSIFLGCNYNDKAIKATFDNLKVRIERDFPITCVIIDKRAEKTAKDLWVDIKGLIEKADYCFFDVTGFRPNVVLELGYAFAVKNSDRIMITFKKRKSKGKSPDWLLTDISHLQRSQYNIVTELEDNIRKEINKMEYIKRFNNFLKETKKDSLPYGITGKKILFAIRDEGSKSEDQLKDYLKGTTMKFQKMIRLLTEKRLIIQDSKKRYSII